MAEYHMYVTNATDFERIRLDFMSGNYNPREDIVEIDILDDIDYKDLEKYGKTYNAPSICSTRDSTIRRPSSIIINGNGHAIKNIYASAFDSWYNFLPPPQNSYQLKNVSFVDYFIINSGGIIFPGLYYYMENVVFKGTLIATGRGGDSTNITIASLSGHASDSVSTCKDVQIYGTYIAPASTVFICTGGPYYSSIDNLYVDIRSNKETCVAISGYDGNSKNLSNFVVKVSNFYYFLIFGKSYLLNGIILLKDGYEGNNHKHLRICWEENGDVDVPFTSYDTGWSSPRKGTNIFFDKELCEANGITYNETSMTTFHVTGETTEHLKNAVYMHETYGMPI